jgi:glutathione S-transferase
MRLYHSPTSPFVRKVMVLLHESGASDGVTLVNAMGTPLDPGTLPVDRNPLGKVPALERDDGPTLYDSRVICRYLDEVLGAGLYPDSPRLWDTLVLEATADGMTDAAVLMRYEMPRPPRRCPLARMDRSAVVQGRPVADSALEDRWTSHLSGPMDMGQIALGAALGYLGLQPFRTRLARRAPRHFRPGSIASTARPSMQETAPKA